MKDDGRGFTVDARTVPVPLLTRWWPARATARHRPEARFRDVTRETFILQRDGDILAEGRVQRLHPGSGPDGLLTLVPGRVDRQTDDEAIHPVCFDQGAKCPHVGRHVAPATDRRQRPSAGSRCIGDRDADASLPKIDAEDRAQGAAPGSAVDRTSTRASSVGIVLTQSGHTDTSAVP